MGIHGIGGGSRSSRTDSTHQTHGPQQTQRPVETQPATEQSNRAPAVRDGFDAPARDFSVLEGVAPEAIQANATPSADATAQANATAVERALESILGGVSEDELKLQQMRVMMEATPTGQAALDYLDSHPSISVTFAEGGASTWNDNTDQIVINSDYDVARAALTLVHEINHAQASFDGPKPDVINDTRDEYVNGMLLEEATGTVESIRAKREMEIAGYPVDELYPGEREYEAAYERAVRDAERSNRDLTPAELDAIGHQEGSEAVLEAFEAGITVRASIEGNPTYPDYYGANWDARHPSP